MSWLSAPLALAQAQRPADQRPSDDDRPGVINEAPPPSPIDGPKGQRFGKPPPPPPPEPAAPLLPPRQAGQGWIGWSVGSGYGWHSEGPLYAASNLRVNSGFGWASLGHFGAELGTQVGETTAFSVVSRHQVIRHVATDPGRGSNAQSWAHSVFLRAVHIMPREGAQLFVGALAGGGQGFHFKIDAQPSQNLPSSDTVRGGAFALGPVAGFILPLVEKLSLVAEARLLAGLPDKAALAELNLGFQFDLFSVR